MDTNYMDNTAVANNKLPQQELTREMLAEFMRRFNGRDADGAPKVVVSYQTYAIGDAEDADKKIYTAPKAAIEISANHAYPDFFVVDFIFRSYDEPELKLLWGRLQKFKNNQAMHAEKDWIFYLNILEKASVHYQTDVTDMLTTAHIFNPELCYLTRETPNLLVSDNRNQDGELVGGNIIRMLVPSKLLTFTVDDQIDTSQIKGDVLRELDTNEFLDNATIYNNADQQNW